MVNGLYTCSERLENMGQIPVVQGVDLLGVGLCPFCSEWLQSDFTPSASRCAAVTNDDWPVKTRNIATRKNTLATLIGLCIICIMLFAGNRNVKLFLMPSFKCREFNT